MAKKDTPQSSAKANNDAALMWEYFTKASIICGAVAAVILILMAIFLV
jgi:hypothetical protein